MSILCLVPVFGTAFGIVLLYFAIWKFKDRKLVLCLASTITISILVGLQLNHNLTQEIKYDKGAAKLMALVAADELNRIAIKLELYKLKYKDYPDSLEQLKKEYPQIHLEDPLLTRNPEIHKMLYFYYRRVGDKYELFSSGIDGIPRNQDDIFPQKSPLDNNRPAYYK